MIHYVCAGDCGGVSDQPGNCQAKSCERFNQPLVECDCADGNHEEVRARLDVQSKE